MNPNVDAFLKRQDKWRAEFAELRAILLASGLTEELKWGKPCYALDGKNVALLHGFKDYCAILFHKGALLHDRKGVLVQQTKNVQAARQIRFSSVEEVSKLEDTVKAYVREAIAIERAGLKVPFKKTEDFALPEEFASKLRANAHVKAAFAALTPGRQRAYIFHFSQPKLSKTRAARVDKHIPRILKGLGLDDERTRPLRIRLGGRPSRDRKHAPRARRRERQRARRALRAASATGPRDDEAAEPKPPIQRPFGRAGAMGALNTAISFGLSRRLA